MQGGWSEVLWGGGEELLYEHLAGYRRQEKGNVLWKHAVEKHNGRKDVNFKMEVVDTFGKDNAKRKTDEALKITGHERV